MSTKKNRKAAAKKKSAKPAAKKSEKSAGSVPGRAAAMAGLLKQVDNLDSRHHSSQETLRKLVQGEKVSDEEIDSLDSKHEPVKPILRAIRDGAVTGATITAITSLDSFAGSRFKSLLLAMATA